MESKSSGYTGGEITALIAPLFDEVSPEDINHAAVIITDGRGNLQLVGCDHAKYLAEMVVKVNATRHAFNTRANYESDVYPFSGKGGWIRRWLGSLLLFL